MWSFDEGNSEFGRIVVEFSVTLSRQMPSYRESNNYGHYGD